MEGRSTRLKKKKEERDLHKKKLMQKGLAILKYVLVWEKVKSLFLYLLNFIFDF